MHINYKKCCFMHFSPNRNDHQVPNDGTMLLTLNGLVIKHVKETKFLGVIIGLYLWHILIVALALTVPLWVLVLIKSIENKLPFDSCQWSTVQVLLVADQHIYGSSKSLIKKN